MSAAPIGDALRTLRDIGTRTPALAISLISNVVLVVIFVALVYNVGDRVIHTFENMHQQAMLLTREAVSAMEANTSQLQETQALLRQVGFLLNQRQGARASLLDDPGDATGLNSARK